MSPHGVEHGFKSCAEPVSIGPGGELPNALAHNQLLFQSVRDFFARFEFSERALEERYMFTTARGAQLLARKFSDRGSRALTALDILAHLFLGQEALPIHRVSGILGTSFFDNLLQLSLVHLDEEHGLCRGAVRIEPLNDLLICSDRVNVGGAFRQDHVYSAWEVSARLFNQVVLRTPCRRFLELCCGAAYMTLKAAKDFAEVAWGVDINERAIYFADFNRCLNGIGRVELRCGSLFEPLHSHSFDRIVAHPPYVPVLADQLLFRDGGIDGERVSAELLRQLPQHLADGGEAYCLLLISDRTSAPAELRIRDMLGSEGNELDVDMLIDSEWPLLTFLSQQAGANRFSDNNERMVESCRHLGITRFLRVALRLQPKKDQRSATRRRHALSW